MAQLPVIFLAFANEQVNLERRLQSLAAEQHRLTEVLEKAETAGLCELVVLSSATADLIVSTFQKARYQGRIALFHFAGHADGYQLLLETAEGQNAVAHGQGLVSFLGGQDSLQLVFLNGCSTQQQSRELVEAGVPAVIGTSQAIADQVATDLAVRFYRAMAEGASIQRAWKEAEDQALMTIDPSDADSRRSLFWDEEDDHLPSFFPWDLYLKPGGEIVQHWNLPMAVDNPLFGLPDPPYQYQPPERPFRFLERYRRQDQQIFFGRSYYIRDLFDRISSSTSAPVILLYGQSGVGKSSMLDAGLFPRLEAVATVVYARRDARHGLLATLTGALHEAGADNLPALPDRLAEETDPADDPQTRYRQRLMEIEALAQTFDPGSRRQLEQAIARLKAPEEPTVIQVHHEGDADEAPTLRAAWYQLEAAQERPLVVLLDQIEEVYTQPIEAQPDELQVFLREVAQIFGDPNDLPRGKLILSYRKEYHPEIEDLFKKERIAREGIFLQQLGKKDIEEVIAGISRDERLQKRYRLSVEPELPAIMADDLLEDKDSPLAPVLQILLTRLWEHEEDNHQREFTVALYQELKRSGDSMGKFLDRQLEELAQHHPHAYHSGLALNVLNFHTTDLGTAAKRKAEDLDARYQFPADHPLHTQRRAELAELRQQLIGLSLLASSGKDSTGLAHDTLAPLVQQRFRNADQPGLRAARILDNKLTEYQTDPSNLLDETDLGIVEAGLDGMRTLDAQEHALIEASQARRAQAQRRRRQVRVAFLALFALIAVAGIVALIQSQLARENEIRALNNLALAKEQTAIADSARQVAEDSTAAAQRARATAIVEREAARLAEQKARDEQARATREAQRARDSAESAQRQRSLAERAQAQALDSARAAQQARLAADSSARVATTRQFLALGRSVAAKAVQLTDDSLQARLAALAYRFNQDHDGSPYDAEIYRGVLDAWQALLGQQANLIGTLEGDPRDLAFLDPQNLFSTGSDGKLTRWHWNEDPAQAESFSLASAGAVSNRALLVDASQNLLVANAGAPQATLLALDGLRGVNPYAATLPYGRMWDLASLPGRGFVFSSQDGLIRRAALAGGQWRIDTIARPGTQAKALAVSPDGRWLAAGGADGQLRLYALGDTVKEAHIPFPPFDGDASSEIGALAFHEKDGQTRLAVGTDAGRLGLFQWRGTPKQAGQAPLWLSGHQARVEALAFRPDGEQLASASRDRSIRLWHIRGTKELPIVLQLDHWAMSVAFSPDGRRIVGGLQFGELRYFPTQAQALYEDLCDKVRTFPPLAEAEWELTWKQYVDEQLPVGPQMICP